MADILKIAAVGIVTAVCVLMLKETRSDIALLLGLAGGTIILLSVLEYFTQIFSYVSALVSETGIDSGIITILIKIVCVGYIAEFSAGVVEDAGSKSLADKIALGGKLVILSMTLPIIKMLFEIVTGLMK